MTAEELIAALQANADRFEAPVAVEVANVGTVYVRRRTVAEFEAMAELKVQEGGGKFGPALARLLCDEHGQRYPGEVADKLSKVLQRQPETVFHALIEAADGTKAAEAAASGN